MARYAVGVDRLYEIEADSPEEAEALLAQQINSMDILVNRDDTVTYEEFPEDECEHEVLELVEAGAWGSHFYYDMYECPDCGSLFYENFKRDGWTDEHGDPFDLDGRELR